MVSGVARAFVDPVLACQVAKVTAAAKRADCLAKQQIAALKGKTTNFKRCEDDFDAAIAAADAEAATQGAACRYVDNGNGTITDLNNLLMWEKKGAGNVDDKYTWATAMGDWISQVNGTASGASPNPMPQPGLAGYNDWRLPSIVDLQSILLAPFPCSSSPCIETTFGPVALGHYWSSTSHTTSPETGAWEVDFTDGWINSRSKGDALHVRAVRSGR